MRATVLEHPREPLRAVTLPDPTPGPGQLLLKVEACGVCRTDLHLRDGEIEVPKQPVVLGLQLGRLLSGQVIIEELFAWPGVGRLLIDSIYGRDYPVIQGLTLVLALLVSLIFLVTDMAQAALDPRIGRR